MPLLVIVVLGTVEACQMVFVKHSLVIAAYEGTRAALAPNGDATIVESATQAVLDARGVANATITVDPADINAADVGDVLSVTVSVPMADNAFFFGNLGFSNAVVTSRVAGMKEY